jgi:hypothetical protein
MWLHDAMRGRALSRSQTKGTRKGSTPPQRGQNATVSGAAEKRQLAVGDKVNLGVAGIAACAAIVGAGLGVGGSIIVAKQNADHDKDARMAEALRSACTNVLKVQGHAKEVMSRMTDALTVGDDKAFESAMAEYNKVGAGGEASVLFATGPDQGLVDAVTDYIASSERTMTAIIQFGAVPRQVRLAGGEAAPVRSELKAMLDASIAVGLECRRQIDALQ